MVDRYKCSHVMHMEFPLQRCGHEFIHYNILAVEFNAADTVLEVCIPKQLALIQIKELNITVIVTRRDNPFISIEGISK